MNRFAYPPSESRADQAATDNFIRIQELESKQRDLEFELRQGDGDFDAITERLCDVRDELYNLRSEV